MSGYELAQLNIALMQVPLDSPQMMEFVANLDPVNAIADAAPGFVWRLQTELGDATALRPLGDAVFTRMPEIAFVLWWVPAGRRPTITGAVERLTQLRQHGSSPTAFTFRSAHRAPDAEKPGERFSFHRRVSGLDLEYVPGNDRVSFRRGAEPQGRSP